MSDDDEITVWINQLADRPETSMDIIWQNYYRKLVGYAKHKLRDMPKRHIDEEDIATDAMNSLFRGAQADRFPDLNDRNDLWKILLTITARKAAKAIRGNMTQKRGGGTVRGESVFVNHLNDDGNFGIGNILGHEPSPELADQVVHQCEDLLGYLEDDVLQQIAALKLEGYTNEEIAKQLDCAVRSVERKLRRIREIWDRTSREDE